MLVLEEPKMRTATREVTRLERSDEGVWLQRLLADIQREVAEQPCPEAVDRIRGRLIAQMDRPAKVAA
jgi:hypothetical protein